MKEKSGYILGIETSTRTFSLALVKDGAAAAKISRKAGRSLDSLLFPGIKLLLDSAGVKTGDISGVAASVGPGYFTGIRIGLAAAKGMAFALGIPAAGVLSLDSLAENSSPSGGFTVCPMIPAGRDEFYCRLYSYDPSSRSRNPLSEPEVFSVDMLLRRLKGKTVILCEDEKAPARIKNALGENALIMPPEMGSPSAENTALLGLKMLKGGVQDSRSIQPVYIRRPEAEENFGGKEPEIKILPAKAKDIDAVMEIERASFPTPWNKAMFAAELIKNSGMFITARTGGILAGYACGWFAADEFHLANLAVSPEYRGRGVGKTLLKNIIDRVKYKDIKYIILEVRHLNLHAIRLYEKFGFQPFARRKGYYRDTGEDAVLMELKL
jgi:tRNA threonylcarbamoyl adenosine modification protein YeaZ/ribosomal-protein-alanine acetyltransferase